MKVVILAGGRGTRISEESSLRPKPLVTIGGHPILWHIMKIYSNYGFQDFIVCCGYKGEYIKRYFVRYGLQQAAVKFSLSQLNENGQTKDITDKGSTENWKVICANTGLETLTAGRILKIKKYIAEDEEFMIT